MTKEYKKGETYPDGECIGERIDGDAIVAVFVNDKGKEKTVKVRDNPKAMRKSRRKKPAPAPAEDA